jgi:hypothetical protein
MKRRALKKRYGRAAKKYPIVYRGWLIEPYEGTQIGHKLPNSRNVMQQIGARTHRKFMGYILSYGHGSDAYTKIVDTLKEGYAYIDDYMGPEPTEEHGR